MHAVIVERNKLVGRRVARSFVAASASAITVEEPAQATPLLAGADVLCADAFDGAYVAEQLRANPALRGVLWTAEPLKRALGYLGESPRLGHVCARKDFESPPRAWEVLMVARRLGGAAAASLSGFLDWGFSSLDIAVRATRDRDSAVAQVEQFVGALQVPRRVAEMFGELTHELVMNAMYDAPVDAQGRAKYAADRTAQIELADYERPGIRIATDGTRLALQVRDPFGRLERHHVVDGLVRGLGAGELDRSRGGAGLGLLVCHNASSALFFDVVKGRSTEVTAVFELDMNLRELRTQAKSLHFWSA